MVDVDGVFEPRFRDWKESLVQLDSFFDEFHALFHCADHVAGGVLDGEVGALGADEVLFFVVGEEVELDPGEFDSVHSRWGWGAEFEGLGCGSVF